MKLIVFLGNPGKEYENTRHNAGFLLSSFLYPEASWQNKFHSEFAQFRDKKLLKPMTMMNLSGKAVSEASSFFKLETENILVVHDDLELPLGEARMQKGGGLQGHNGLKDIKTHLKSTDFYRLRIGIGRPVHNDVRNWVLSPFKSDEMIKLEQLFTLIKKNLDENKTSFLISLDS